MKGAISYFSPYVSTTLSDFLSPKIIIAFCAEAFTILQQKFRLKSESLNPHIFCCICTELKWFVFNMLCEHNGLTPSPPQYSQRLSELQILPSNWNKCMNKR